MDPFVSTYYLKKAILVYQFVFGVYPNLRDLPIGAIEDYEGFCNEAASATDYLNAKILAATYSPELTEMLTAYNCSNILEVVECCDFDVITSKHHGNKFFNEIENEEIISFFIDKFEEIWDVDDNGDFFIEIYDWNDYPIYFKTFDDMMSLFHNYDCTPCTAFEVVNGHSQELWSA